VRVELIRHERVPRNEGNEKASVEARAVLGENHELAAVPHDYPFELTIPGGTCPSLKTEQSEARWYLRGVVARRVRLDYEIKQELNVYTAPAPAVPAPELPPANALDTFKRPPGGG